MKDFPYDAPSMISDLFNIRIIDENTMDDLILALNLKELSSTKVLEDIGEIILNWDNSTDNPEDTVMGKLTIYDAKKYRSLKKITHFQYKEIVSLNKINPFMACLRLKDYIF